MYYICLFFFSFSCILLQDCEFRAQMRSDLAMNGILGELGNFALSYQNICSQTTVYVVEFVSYNVNNRVESQKSHDECLISCLPLYGTRDGSDV